MDQKIIKVEDITDEDVKEFEKYLNEFISVVQNSIGHEEKRGNKLRNWRKN